MEDLEKLVKVLQTENDKRAAADPVTQASLDIVRDFLKTHPVLCYGGTAINNLLPPEDRFYNPEVDIPDYDFFSKTPQEHAMFLANKLAERGVKSVEVRPGMHLGTFKVFADFEGVADITFLESQFFDRLWDENITRDGIHYVSPNFLRMSMYLELSRPRGDVSRWTKVYDRLQRLNKHYPVECPVKTEEHPEIDAERKKAIVHMLKTEPVVLLGITAAEIHLRKPWTTPVMVLAEKETIEKLTAGHKLRVDPGNELLATRYSVPDENGKSHVFFYETTACHSYHKMSDGIRVASIPTILQFFFAYTYSGGRKENIASILCVAERIMQLVKGKTKRRFDMLIPIDCIGTQHTLTDMRKQKAVLYEDLSKNKSSADFVRYFFTYNPHAPKTERQKIRNRLRATRKQRLM